MINNLSEAVELIKPAKKVGLITHFKSDGDAIGSLLALRGILEQLGKEVVVFSNEDIREEVGFLKIISSYEYKDDYEHVDLLIMLDTSLKKRLTCPNILNDAKKDGAKLLVIDHHQKLPEDEANDVSLRAIDVSSTAEIVYELSESLGVQLTQQGAEYLLVGIITDTSFLNVNTHRSTKKIKKELIKIGGRADYIVQKIIDHNPILSNKTFKEELDKRAVFDKKNAIVAILIKEEDYAKYKLEPGASSIVANYLDWEFKPSMVLVLEQREEGKVKVSMRSNHSDIDVSRIASIYGGGGHIKAAGCEVPGDAEKDFDKIVEDVTAKLVDTSFE